MFAQERETVLDGVAGDVIGAQRHRRMCFLVYLISHGKGGMVMCAALVYLLPDEVCVPEASLQGPMDRMLWLLCDVVHF